MKVHAYLYSKRFCVLLLILALASGCPIAGNRDSGIQTNNIAATEVGNPPPVTISSPPFVSALPVPYPKEMRPDSFISALLNVEDQQGNWKRENVLVSPDITWTTNDTFFVTGADRGMQIADLPTDDLPTVRGSLFIPGRFKDLDLVGDIVYLLSDTSLNTVNVSDRDLPLLENDTALGTNTIKIVPYQSKLARLSQGTDGYTELDIVSAANIEETVSKGLILPIKTESERQFGNRLWITGLSIQNGKSYLLGIDLDLLLLVTDLSDLSDLIPSSGDSLPEPPPASPLVSLTEIPTNDFFKEGFDRAYFDRIMQMYGIKIMKMFYGLWLDGPLYVVISEGALHVYDLSQQVSSPLVVPLSFQPEYFVISGSTLILSYLEKVDPPEGEDPSKEYSAYYYNVFDFTNPAEPTITDGLNVPGTILSLNGDEALTLDFSWNQEGNFTETIKSIRIGSEEVEVLGKYQLPQRSLERMVAGKSVIAILSDDAKKWSDLILVIDFSDPANPSVHWQSDCKGLGYTDFIGDDTCGAGLCAAPNNTPSTCVDGQFSACVPGTPPETQEVSCSDGLDNDCDGKTDGDDRDCLPCQDLDGDGYGNPGDPSCDKGPEDDCDDNKTNISPGQEEVCNGVDDNCDGNADEGLDIINYYNDNDKDDYGDSAILFEGCSMALANAPGAFVENNTDCNDSNSSIHPGVSEICDDLDQNCDSEPDEELDNLSYYLDLDNDGYGTPSTLFAGCSEAKAQAKGAFVENNLDCNDSNALIHPDMDEDPNNSIDDNCNDVTDEVNVGLKPNHDYELHIFPTDQILQGTFVVAQPVDTVTGQFNTSFTLLNLPGSFSLVMIDSGVNLSGPLVFGSGMGGDGYVGTLKFTTNADATGFVGTTGTSSDLQIDTNYFTNGLGFAQEYRPEEFTQSDIMPIPVQLGSLFGYLAPNGAMILVPDGRIAGYGPAYYFLTGSRWNVNPNGEWVAFSTDFQTNSLGTVHGNRITPNGDGTYSVTLVSAGTFGKDWSTWAGATYFEVWKGIIVELGPADPDSTP